MVTKQEPRENDTPTIAELALKLKPLLAAQAKEHERLSKGKGIQKSGDLKTNAIRTDKEIAKMAGVSHDTINRKEVKRKMETSAGKGLSELQRLLLLRALENVDAIDALRKRIRDVYEGRAEPGRVENDRPHLSTLRALKGRGGKIARITTIKTFRTLIKRNLARRWFPKNSEGGYVWLGIDLTTEGKEVARRIAEGY